MKNRLVRKPPPIYEEPKPKKKSNIEDNEEKIFGLYSSDSSPIITMTTKFDSSSVGLKFTRKVYHKIQEECPVSFPSVSKEETIIQLKELQQQYSEPKEENKEEIDDMDLLTKKEKRLILAANLLTHSTLSFKAIAVEVSLKPNDVQNMKRRLLKTGEIFPQKKRN